MFQEWIRPLHETSTSKNTISNMIRPQHHLQAYYENPHLTKTVTPVLKIAEMKWKWEAIEDIES